jgi:hypothetical protein
MTLKLAVLFHLVLIKHFVFCINTLLCILINQYSVVLDTGSYSVKTQLHKINTNIYFRSKLKLFSFFLAKETYR